MGLGLAVGGSLYSCLEILFDVVSWSMAGVQVKDPLALSLMAAYFAVATSFWRSTVASWWKDVVDDE